MDSGWITTPSGVQRTRLNPLVEEAFLARCPKTRWLNSKLKIKIERTTQRELQFQIAGRFTASCGHFPETIQILYGPSQSTSPQGAAGERRIRERVRNEFRICRTSGTSHKSGVALGPGWDLLDLH